MATSSVITAGARFLECRDGRLNASSNIETHILCQVFKDPSCAICVLFYTCHTLTSFVFADVDLTMAPHSIIIGCTFFTIIASDAVVKESRRFNMVILVGFTLNYLVYLPSSLFEESTTIAYNITINGLQQQSTLEEMRRGCLTQIITFLLPLMVATIVDKKRNKMRILRIPICRHTIVHPETLDFRTSKEHAVVMFEEAKKEQNQLAILNRSFSSHICKNKILGGDNNGPNSESTEASPESLHRPDDSMTVAAEEETMRQTTWESAHFHRRRRASTVEGLAQGARFQRSVRYREIAYTACILCGCIPFYVWMTAWEQLELTALLNSENVPDNNTTITTDNSSVPVQFPLWFTVASISMVCGEFSLFMFRFMHPNIDFKMLKKVMTSPVFVYISLLYTLVLGIEIFVGQNNVHFIFTIGFGIMLLTICFSDVFIFTTRLFEIVQVVIAMSALAMTLVCLTFLNPDKILFTISKQQYGRNYLLRTLFTQILTFMAPILVEIIQDKKRVHLHVLDRPYYRFELYAPLHMNNVGVRRVTDMTKQLETMRSVSDRLSGTWVVE